MIWQLQAYVHRQCQPKSTINYINYNDIAKSKNQAHRQRQTNLIIPIVPTLQKTNKISIYKDRYLSIKTKLPNYPSNFKETLLLFL